jgi:hypothetical protein
MKMTTVMLKFCAILGLIAGVSVAGTGCIGGGGGGGGSSCPEGQVKASIDDGPMTCLESCEVGTDCSEAGASCTSGVCVGPGTNNGGADAGGDAEMPEDATPVDNDGGDGGGDDCPVGQVKASVNGGAEQCYDSCVDVSECSGANAVCTSGICVDDDSNDVDAGGDAGNDTTINPIPTGVDSCADVIQCVFSCPQGDANCPDACVADGTDEAQTKFGAFESCIQTHCTGNMTTACIQTNCSNEMDTCVGCSGNATVDLNVGLGFQCTTQCTSNSDCPVGQSCDDPILASGAVSVCSHDMSGLAGACTSDSDCPTPDTSGAQAACITQDGNGDTISGGFCVAVGCNDAEPYGSESGCGLDGYCFSGDTQTSCSLLCNTQSDCPRGSTDDFACNIFQERDDGSLLGTCGLSCTTNADCAGQNFQGRCHAKGYCEYPCDPSDPNNQCEIERGGTCQGTGTDGFCVFE